MEIKYTLEILIKDIQDIEKLVGNLHNSPEGSTLELDLALSKLRNVYDILTVIRADVEQAVRTAASQPPPPVQVEKPPVEEPPVQVEKPPVEEPPVQVEKPGPATPRNPSIIAEKFTTESSINENMAGSREGALDSKLIGQPIESISRNIGINDRFLIIRELFDGDSDGFGKLVENLDKAGDLQAARKLIEEHFAHKPDHEGVSILTNLVKRRYNRN
jgi:hypothetical protein